MGVGTKGTYSVQDWAAVAQNTIAKSAEADLSGFRSSILHIQAALDTTTAHTGTRFVVQISAIDSGNENWQDHVEFVGLIGTATTDLIENDPLAVGATSITLTGHALTALGEWLFIEDGTLANSEIVMESAQTTNAISLLDGTTNEHAVGVAIFNVVMEQNIDLPVAAKRARLLIDNTTDGDGSSLCYKLRISKSTGA